MRITILIEDGAGGQMTQVEKVTEGCLSDAADVVSNAITAAFGYTVHSVMVTEQAAFDRDGYISE